MNPRIHLKVMEKIRETEQAATLVLEVMEGDFQYQAGQFLTFIFDSLAPEEVRRSYSMSSAPGVDPFPAVTVQRQANGSVHAETEHLLLPSFVERTALLTELLMNL